jgi:hypothetical protein
VTIGPIDGDFELGALLGFAAPKVVRGAGIGHLVAPSTAGQDVFMPLAEYAMIWPGIGGILE